MEEAIQTPGAPWDIYKFADTFSIADAIRNEKLEEEGMQAKVHWLPSVERFVVKTRKDPNLVEPKKKPKKKAQKKAEHTTYR